MKNFTKCLILLFTIFLSQFGTNCTSKKMKKIALIADKNLDISSLKLLQSAQIGHINLFYVIQKSAILEEEKEEDAKRVYEKIESNSYNLNWDLLFKKEKIPSEIGNIPSISFNDGKFFLLSEDSTRKYEADIIVYMLTNSSSQNELKKRIPNLSNIHFLNSKNKDSTILSFQKLILKYDNKDEKGVRGKE